MKALECVGKRIINAEIIDAVFERPPHQKFHAEVIDAFGSRILCSQMKFLVLFRHDVPDAHDDCLIDLLTGCFLRDHAEVAGKFPRDEAVRLLFRQFAHE